MIQDITSKENKFYKSIKKLKQKSERDKTGLFLAEGARIALDAVASGCAECLFISERYGVFDTHLPVYRVSDQMFAQLCETDTPQGILAVCKIRRHSLSRLSGDTIVLCDGVSDPGNLGTIIRTAECTGVGGIILLKGTADPYSPKVVRSTMGSVFRVPLYFAQPEDLAALQEYTLLATALDGSEDLYKTDFPEKTAVVIGNEAHGVSRQVLDLAEKHIRIPMEGGAESLNAAVAGAVVLYEIYRRRRNQ